MRTCSPENRERMKKTYERDFLTPAIDAFVRLAAEARSDTTPLLEALKLHGILFEANSMAS